MGWSVGKGVGRSEGLIVGFCDADLVVGAEVVAACVGKKVGSISAAAETVGD